MCLSVQAITFEPLHIETSVLVCRYILTISRKGLSIKVIGSKSYGKNDNFTYFNMSILCVWPQVINKSNFTYFNTLILCVWPQVINKVKFIHQGEGHIKVKVKYLHLFIFYVAHTLYKRVVCIRLNAFLFSYT